MLTISYVRPLYVGATWPLIKTWVNEVCEMSGGRKTPAKALAEIFDGVTQLWVAHDENNEVKAFATTRINNYDAVKMLNIELVGGVEMDQWLTDETMQTLIKFAQDNGCSGLEGQGRGRAWARKLKQYGWSEYSTSIEMRFE